MKLIAIGDTHGRDTWKQIVSKEHDSDKIIFIGDYFDTKENISCDRQIENFKKILEIKIKEPDKFVLLIGNHDFHYLKSTEDRYSGYQNDCAKDISRVVYDAIDKNLLQMCFVSDNNLFVHAGVTKTWCRTNKIDENNLENTINKLFIDNPNAFAFTAGKYNNLYGDEICQTPIWVRPRSLAQDKIDNFFQIVGHTQVRRVTFTDDFVLIDVLGYTDEYLIVKDGNKSVGRL